MESSAEKTNIGEEGGGGEEQNRIEVYGINRKQRKLKERK